MLYYGAVNKEDVNQNTYWCGKHFDHGLLAGLTPEVYFKDGQPAAKPQRSGLFIQDKAVNVGQDVLLFQVGEALQLLTNNKIRAAEHYVKKAYGNYERFAFASFFKPKDTFVINSRITDFNNRFINGMTYDEWSQASFQHYRSIS